MKELWLWWLRQCRGFAGALGSLPLCYVIILSLLHPTTLEGQNDPFSCARFLSNANVGCCIVVVILGDHRGSFSSQHATDPLADCFPLPSPLPGPPAFKIPGPPPARPGPLALSRIIGRLLADTHLARQQQPQPVAMGLPARHCNLPWL